MNDYSIGDQVRITGNFANTAGTATDPTTVAITVKYPRFSGNPTTTTYTYPATIVKDSTGVFHVDVTVTTEGIWDYRIVGTGAVVSAEEGAFNVPDSQFF